MSQLGWLIAATCAAGGGAAVVWSLRLRAKLVAGQRAQQLEQRAAEERELLLRTLLDASPLAVVFYADAGRIVYTNAPAGRMFFEGQAAEGKNFLNLVSAGPEAFRVPLLSANEEIASFEIDGQRETYHFVRRTFPYANEPHTLLVVRHVTHEVARHELSVLKRVVRLLSHEVNNSLAPVSSLVHSARQIVKTGERMERLSRVFDTVEERAQHLSQFIAGYAALAHLPQPSPKEVEWETLLVRLRVLYPEAKLTAPSGARGHFDLGQVEQALINLLKNASEAGGRADEVALEVSTHADGGSLLRVLDRGQGFASEALENALLPFFTTKPHGSGVGLPLVREIAAAHGGQLSLGPREGGGVVATLRLPDRRRRPSGDAAQARLTLTRR